MKVKLILTKPEGTKKSIHLTKDEGSELKTFSKLKVLAYEYFQDDTINCTYQIQASTGYAQTLNLDNFEEAYKKAIKDNNGDIEIKMYKEKKAPLLGSSFMYESETLLNSNLLRSNLASNNSKIAMNIFGHSQLVDSDMVTKMKSDSYIPSSDILATSNSIIHSDPGFLQGSNIVVRDLSPHNHIAMPENTSSKDHLSDPFASLFYQDPNQNDSGDQSAPKKPIHTPLIATPYNYYPQSHSSNVNPKGGQNSARISELEAENESLKDEVGYLKKLLGFETENHKNYQLSGLSLIRNPTADVKKSQQQLCDFIPHDIKKDQEKSGGVDYNQMLKDLGVEVDQISQENQNLENQVLSYKNYIHQSLANESIFQSKAKAPGPFLGMDSIMPPKSNKDSEFSRKVDQDLKNDSLFMTNNPPIDNKTSIRSQDKTNIYDIVPLKLIESQVGIEIDKDMFDNSIFKTKVNAHIKPSIVNYVADSGIRIDMDLQDDSLFNAKSDKKSDMNIDNDLLGESIFATKSNISSNKNQNYIINPEITKSEVKIDKDLAGDSIFQDNSKATESNIKKDSFDGIVRSVRVMTEDCVIPAEYLKETIDFTERSRKDTHSTINDDFNKDGDFTKGIDKSQMCDSLFKTNKNPFNISLNKESKVLISKKNMNDTANFDMQDMVEKFDGMCLTNTILRDQNMNLRLELEEQTKQLKMIEDYDIKDLFGSQRLLVVNPLDEPTTSGRDRSDTTLNSKSQTDLETNEQEKKSRSTRVKTGLKDVIRRIQTKQLRRDNILKEKDQEIQDLMLTMGKMGENSVIKTSKNEEIKASDITFSYNLQIVELKEQVEFLQVKSLEKDTEISNYVEIIQNMGGFSVIGGNSRNVVGQNSVNPQQTNEIENMRKTLSEKDYQVQKLTAELNSIKNSFRAKIALDSTHKPQSQDNKKDDETFSRISSEVFTLQNALRNSQKELAEKDMIIKKYRCKVQGM